MAEVTDIPPVAGLEEPIEEPSPNGHTKPISSTLDWIRNRRAEFQRERHTEREIPGYEGRLVARYRVLDYEEHHAIAERVEKMKPNPRAELYGQVDSLIKACEGLYVRQEDGTLESIDPTADIPVGFTVELGNLLGFGVEKARQVVLQLFPSELAIVEHYTELGDFWKDASEEVDEELVGESQGGRR